MQPNNNPFEPISDEPAVQPQTTGNGLPMPPVDASTASQPTDVKPLRTIDGVSLDYGNDEPLPAPASGPIAMPTMGQASAAAAPDISAFDAAGSTYQPPITEPPIAQSPVMPVAEPESAPAPITLDNAPLPMASDQPGDFTNQLATEANVETPTASTPEPLGTVPSLNDTISPDATVIDVQPNGGKKRHWLTTIAIGVAILGIAGSIFFFIEYRMANASYENATSQLDEWQTQAQQGQQASNQVEDLQNTVRNQATQIDNLKKENDGLKTVSDDLKKAQAQITQLQTDKDTAQNQITKCLSNDQCKAFLL